MSNCRRSAGQSCVVMLLSATAGCHTASSPEDWQNSEGDVVRYSLRYDSPCEGGPVRRDEPGTARLRVTVGILPAAAARAAREARGTVFPGRQ
jgi:hypothetical protein